MAQSKQVAGINDWHESLMDYIIANPQADLRMKAQVFGVTMSWISIVENSDSFKEQMRLRRNEHFGNVSRGIVQKLEATADMVVEEINKRIQQDAGGAISFNTLKDTADMALKHLGFGRVERGDQTAGVINNNTIIVEDRRALKEARAAMAAAREGRSINEFLELEKEEELELENEKELENDQLEIFDVKSPDLPE